MAETSARISGTYSVVGAQGGETTSGLAALIARIKQDGVEAGEVERRALLEAARQEAADIVTAGHKQAERVLKTAEQEATARRAQLDAELRMAARDFVFRFRERIIQQVVGRVADAAAAATVGDDAALAELVVQLLGDRAMGATLTANPALQARVRAALGARVDAAIAAGGVELVDSAGQGGFRLQRQGEHFVWDVTEAAIARELAQLVGPDLAAALANVGDGSQKA